MASKHSSVVREKEVRESRCKVGTDGLVLTFDRACDIERLV